MALENILGDLALNETLVATNVKLDTVISELSQKLEPGGEVSLSVNTLTSLESVTALISNLPSDFPDANVLAKLEAIRVLLAGQLSVNIGLTNAELRNSPIPISGTVTANTGLSQPITDAQLRASSLPVSLASIPIPIGASTESKQIETINSLASILAVDFAKEATIQSIVKSEDTVHFSGDKGIMLLGLRSDSDTATASNGNYSVMKLDEYGRLKVASTPASYADVIGSITAIQATVVTPVAGGTVIGDVSRASNVMMFCTGTFAGINVSFEGCLEATGENWFSVQAVRSNANTIETATGALSAMPLYAWELSVNALARVRVRCTARTSGTQNWLFKLGTYATEPIPASQVTATQAVSGTVTSNGGTIATPTASNINSLATTNANIVKASAGSVYNIAISNIGASPRYVKLYNKATAVTVGTDIPVLTIVVPAGALVQNNFGILGHRFTVGIGLAITSSAIDSDTTVIGANEVKILTSFV